MTIDLYINVALIDLCFFLSIDINFNANRLIKCIVVLSNYMKMSFKIRYDNETCDLN